MSSLASIMVAFLVSRENIRGVIQTSRGDFTRVQFERAVSAFGENYFVYDTKVTP